MRIVPQSLARTPLPPAILATVVALATAPFLTGTYVFLLDFTVGPAWEPVSARLYGFRNPAYGGSLPLFAVLAGIGELVGPAIAQKVLLGGLLAFTAASGYVSLPGGRWARLYGALVLLVNPFVYTRLLAGHWAVVWGLAALPLVMTAYTDYLEGGRFRHLIFSIGALTLLGFSAHLAYVSTVLLVALTVFRYADCRRSVVLRRGVTVALVAVPVNAYWLGPAVVSRNAPLGDGLAADLSTFAPQADSSALFATASMRGFWREGFVSAVDLVPQVQAVYAAILLLAVYGAVTHVADPGRGYVVRALLVTSAVALFLGAGLSGPAAPVFRWLADHVPFFGGLRDSNKFVALLVVAHAYLGALGASRLWESVRRVDRSRWLATLVVAGLVLAPLAYTFPMVTGYAGQIQGEDYPEEWYEVEEMLDADDGEYSVLFLPWHQYMDYSWVDGRQRIATPARQFFSKPIIQGDNVEAGGTYSTSDNPVSGYVEFVFGLGPENDRLAVSNMGKLLAQIDVEYVLLTTEADWRPYESYLDDQRDLTLVRENDYFRVYRNDYRSDRPGRASGTNHVTYVRNVSQFVALSQERDVTGVYAVDPGNTRRTNRFDDADHEPLRVSERLPALHRVSGTDREYTVVTRTQRTVGPGWRYDGDSPAFHHLGIHPAFESRAVTADLRYAPFYRLFLPSYVVSGLSVVVLIWYGRSSSAGATARRLWRRTVHNPLERFNDD